MGKKANANSNMHLMKPVHFPPCFKIIQTYFFPLKLNDRPGVSIKYMQNTFAGAKSLRYDATITDRVKPPCAKTSSCTKDFDKYGP